MLLCCLDRFFLFEFGKFSRFLPFYMYMYVLLLIIIQSVLQKYSLFVDRMPVIITMCRQQWMDGLEDECQLPRAINAITASLPASPFRHRANRPRERMPRSAHR